MARVTVEDCVQLVPNRFELVMMSAQRARELAAGAVLMVDRDRDKNPVVALREIAEEKLDLENLRDTLVRGHQHQIDQDLPQDDLIELMAGEQGWVQQASAAAAEELPTDGDDEEFADEDDGVELMDLSGNDEEQPI